MEIKTTYDKKWAFKYIRTLGKQFYQKTVVKKKVAKQKWQKMRFTLKKLKKSNLDTRED